MVQLQKADRAVLGVVVVRIDGGTGVDAEDSLTFADELGVGVAGDDHVGFALGPKALDPAGQGEIRVAGCLHRDVVGEPHREPFEVVEGPDVLHPLVLRLDGPAPGAVLAVAASAVDRRNALELVEQSQVVYVAAVEDAIDASEGIEHLRPELGAGFGNVGVGHQADFHGHGRVPHRPRDRPRGAGDRSGSKFDRLLGRAYPTRPCEAMTRRLPAASAP